MKIKVTTLVVLCICYNEPIALKLSQMMYYIMNSIAFLWFVWECSVAPPIDDTVMCEPRLILCLLRRVVFWSCFFFPKCVFGWVSREGGPISCRCVKTQSVIRSPNLPGVAYDGYRVQPYSCTILVLCKWCTYIDWTITHPRPLRVVVSISTISGFVQLCFKPRALFL